MTFFSQIFLLAFSSTLDNGECLTVPVLADNIIRATIMMHLAD